MLTPMAQAMGIVATQACVQRLAGLSWMVKLEFHIHLTLLRVFVSGDVFRCLFVCCSSPVLMAISLFGNSHKVQ